MLANPLKNSHCLAQLTEKGGQDIVTESEDYLLASLRPLRAQKVEQGGREGGEEGEETARLHSHQVAQNVQ